MPLRVLTFPHCSNSFLYNLYFDNPYFEGEYMDRHTFPNVPRPFSNFRMMKVTVSVFYPDDFNGSQSLTSLPQENQPGMLPRHS